MPDQYQPGDEVRVLRPATYKGRIGRYVEDAGAGQAWIALGKTNATTPPTMANYNNQSNFPRRLLSFDAIEPAK